MGRKFKLLKDLNDQLPPQIPNSFLRNTKPIATPLDDACLLPPIMRPQL